MWGSNINGHTTLQTEKGMVQELIKAAMTGKEEGHDTQYPVQEYMIGLDGLPMTPDIGTVIGDHVQNRLSTADDAPPIPEPSVSSLYITSLSLFILPLYLHVAILTLPHKHIAKSILQVSVD